MRVMRRIFFSITYLYLISVMALANANSAERVYESVKDSVFAIYSIDEENKEKTAFGSGVAVTNELIATNCHVALSGRFLIVEVKQQKNLGRLFYYNQEKDLCLIEIVSSPLNPVHIRPSKSVNIGEEVFAIGNPEGLEKTISQGIISNKITDGSDFELQTDAAISHGSSGGGLFDKDGNLIGITTSASKNGENIGFAIPTELILDVIGQQTNSKIINQKEQVATEKLPVSSDKNKLIKIGYYGEDDVALMSWDGKCFIGIVGKYGGVPKSLAIWFPTKPEGLFIFSRISKAENAIKYFNLIKEKNNIEYVQSKSYLFFDKKLYPLPIMSINNIKQPVYIFALNGEITEELIALDYFLGQFYRYNQEDGLTTIKFGLDGFTDAFSAYNRICK